MTFNSTANANSAVNTKLKFTNKHHSSFFSDVRKRVDNYFIENSISKKGNLAMWLKASTFLVGFFARYFLIISNLFNPSTMLVFSILLGAFSAFIGFNICHDAIHGALSSDRKSV